MLRARLARPGRVPRLVDVVPVTPEAGEEAVTASATDMAAMTAARAGADAVIQLGGIAGEAAGERLLDSTVRHLPRAGGSPPGRPEPAAGAAGRRHGGEVAGVTGVAWPEALR